MVNIALPLLPLCLLWILQSARKQKFSLRETIKDGQLCFYPVAILGVAAFDYIPIAIKAIQLNNWTHAQSVIVFGMVGVLLASIVAYAIFQLDHVSKRNEISDLYTRNVSLGLTLAAIAITYNSHIC